jgi:mono/diheme cytochrome c family protein
MFNQPKQKPLSESTFFPDGAAARHPPKGTVPRNANPQEAALASAVDPSGAFLAQAPLPVDRALLERGKERFEIYCSPCHGFTGDGNGMIVQRGYKRPPSFHIDRLRQQPIGYFVDVIEHGFGQMPAYADKVRPRDRWAISAYVGALQLSQSASYADLAPEDAARIQELQ